MTKQPVIKSIRISSELSDRIAAIAESTDRSWNKTVNKLLENYFQQLDKKKANSDNSGECNNKEKKDV